FKTPAGLFQAAPGDVVVIPALMPHASEASSTSAVTHLYIEETDPAAHGIAAPQIIRSTRARSPAEVIDLVGSMRRAASFNERGIPASWLEPVLQGAGISMIARRLGYSSDGFSRAFHREAGMTPVAYRVAHRLALARSHLKNGGEVVDAAYLAS